VILLEFCEEISVRKMWLLGDEMHLIFDYLEKLTD